MAPTSIKKARTRIAHMLAEAGWAVQDRGEIDLAAALGVAVREDFKASDRADYVVYLGQQLVGLILAKEAGNALLTVEMMAREDDAKAKQRGLALLSVEERVRDDNAKASLPSPVPLSPLPFLYESSGGDTRFTNGIDPEVTSSPLLWFPRPEALRAWLDAELTYQAAKGSATQDPR